MTELEKMHQLSTDIADFEFIHPNVIKEYRMSVKLNYEHNLALDEEDKQYQSFAEDSYIENDQ